MVAPRRLAGLSSAPPGSALPSDLLASAAARLYPSMDAEGDGDRAPRATGDAQGFAWVAPVADAVETVLAAVGEGGLGATYCARVRDWHRGLLERLPPTIGRVPQAVYDAASRLPADRREPHRVFVAAVAAAAALVRKRSVQRGRFYCPSTADSLSSEVRGRSGARTRRVLAAYLFPAASPARLTVSYGARVRMAVLRGSGSRVPV